MTGGGCNPNYTPSGAITKLARFTKTRCCWEWGMGKQASAVLPDAMPNQCQANANQMPTRCQPDANQMPRKMPIRCRIGDMSYIHACPMEYSGIPPPLVARRGIARRDDISISPMAALHFGLSVKTWCKKLQLA